MGLIACPVKGKQKSVDICAAFIAGAPKHAEGYVFYGVNETNLRDFDTARRSGKPWYYVDNSYFDSVRGRQFRVTRDALQVDAMAHATDGKRFDALDLKVKPMQSNPKGHWVVIEQSPGFMRLLTFEPDWYATNVARVKNSGRDVIERRWDNDKLALQKTLVQDLQGAWGLLTYSSAAAVTALLEGIPCIVSHDSAVAHVRLSTDNSVDDRRHAFGVLADHQWTLNEMKEGLAWAKLAR
jgi:phosphohistidine swiveling domain-containing protein